MARSTSSAWYRLRRVGLAGLLLNGLASAGAKAAEYDPGATDTGIKIGQTFPYSGPLSAAGEMGLTEAAYVKMLNENGGINKRTIELISLDDAYSPPKTVEQTRRLVERENVLFIFHQFGSPTATAVQKYLNTRKVPQLFAATGSARFTDPAFPWSSSMLPNYIEEGRILARYVVGKSTDAKVAILYQNDDFGKDYLKGFREILRDAPGVKIVSEASYEPTQPTIDSQMSSLAKSGATVFLNVTTGRATVQSIRTLASLDWKPLHLLNGQWADIGSIFKPAGLDVSSGIVTSRYIKAPDDPQWENDPAIRAYKTFMAKYRPGADIGSKWNVESYFYSQVLEYVLRRAGDKLTRQNINDIASSMQDVRFDMLLPGVTITTTPQQRHLISKKEMMRFDGQKFVAADR